MSIALNTAVSNQRIYWTAPVNAGTLAFAWSGWIYANDRTLTGTIFSCKSGAAVGLSIVLTNQQIQFARENVAGGAFFLGVKTGNVITANATWFHVAVQHDGDEVPGTANWAIWVNGTPRSLVDVGSGGNKLASLAGGTWDWGNAGDLLSPFKGRIRDAAIWTHNQGSSVLSDAEAATLYNAGGGIPPRFLIPASGATLRQAPTMAAAASGTGTVCPIINAAATRDNGPTAPGTPDAGAPTVAAYQTTPVDTTGIMYLYDCRKYCSATTDGRLIDLHDLSGGGNTLYHDNGYVSSSRPGYKNSIAAENGKLDNFWCFDNAASSGTLLVSNAAGTFNNGTWSMSFVVAKNGTFNGARFFEATNTNNLRVTTNDSGFLVIRMNSTDHAATKLRPYANKCVVGITVTQANAASAKTIRLFLDGVFVEQIVTAAFSEQLTSMSLVGPNTSLGSGTVGNYQIWWQFAGYNIAKSDAQMSAIASDQMAVFGVPTSRVGTVVRNGSSTMSAAAFPGFNRDWPYLADPRLIQFNCALSNTRLTTHNLVVNTAGGGANATAFVAGETITQAVSLATLQFVCEVNGEVLANRLTGTPDFTNQISGATAIRNVTSGTGNIATNPGQTAALQLGVVDAILQDPQYPGNYCLLWQFGANDLPLGVSAATTDAAVAAVMALRPAPPTGKRLLKVAMSAHPRTGTVNLGTFRTLLKARVGAAIDAYADYCAVPPLNDFAGTTSYQNLTFMQADQIHMVFAGYLLGAAAESSVMNSLFGLGGSVSRFDRLDSRFARFPRF